MGPFSEQQAASQSTLSLSSPRVMVRRFWLRMGAVVALVLPGVMMIAGEMLMLPDVLDAAPVMSAGCWWLLLVLLLSVVSLLLLLKVVALSLRLRLPTPPDDHTSSGVLAIRLTSDGASEQMDMRATVASCRPLRLLGRRPLFFTRPSSSSSIGLGFSAPFSPSQSPSASSRERSEELSLERIPESDESFLSRMISVRKPGLVSSPVGWELLWEERAPAPLWRRGVVLSASSGPESSSLGTLWYSAPAPLFLVPGVREDALWFSSSSLMGSRSWASAPDGKSVESLALEPLLMKDLRLSWSAPSLA